MNMINMWHKRDLIQAAINEADKILTIPGPNDCSNASDWYDQEMQQVSEQREQLQEDLQRLENQIVEKELMLL